MLFEVFCFCFKMSQTPRKPNLKITSGSQETSRFVQGKFGYLASFERGLLPVKISTQHLFHPVFYY